MITRINLYTVGGVSAMLYAIITLSLYVYLWTRWSILKDGEANQILIMVDQKSGEWTSLWWGITIIPLALIPVFLAVLRLLWKEGSEALAAMAFVAGMVALILGVIGPLRGATTTKTLAHIFATGNEIQKVAAQVVYTSGESYGKGLFCLFGAT